MDVDKEFDEIMTELYWETEGYTSKSPKIPDIQARLDKFVERLTIFNDDDREDPSLRPSNVKFGTKRASTPIDSGVHTTGDMNLEGVSTPKTSVISTPSYDDGIKWSNPHTRKLTFSDVLDYTPMSTSDIYDTPVSTFSTGTSTYSSPRVPLYTCDSNYSTLVSSGISHISHNRELNNVMPQVSVPYISSTDVVPNYTQSIVSNPSNVMSKPLFVPTMYKGQVGFEDWYLSFDNARIANRWDDWYACKFLVSRLDGLALKAYNDLDSRTQNHYQSLVQALKLKFDPIRQADEYVVELENLVSNKNTSLQKLAIDITRLVRKGFPNDSEFTRNRMAVHYFLRAIPDSEIQIQVARQKPSDIDTALTMVSSELSILRRFKSKKTQIRAMNTSSSDSKRNSVVTDTKVINSGGEQDSIITRQMSDYAGSNKGGTTIKSHKLTSGPYHTGNSSGLKPNLHRGNDLCSPPSSLSFYPNQPVPYSSGMPLQNIDNQVHMGNYNIPPVPNVPRLYTRGFSGNSFIRGNSRPNLQGRYSGQFSQDRPIRPRYSQLCNTRSQVDPRNLNT